MATSYEVAFTVFQFVSERTNGRGGMNRRVKRESLPNHYSGGTSASCVACRLVTCYCVLEPRYSVTRNAERGGENGTRKSRKRTTRTPLTHFAAPAFTRTAPPN